MAGDLDQLPEYQNVAGERRSAVLVPGEARPTRTSAARSATWTTRTDSGGRSSREIDDIDGTTVPIAYAHVRQGLADPAGALVGLAAQRRRVLDRRLDHPFANFFFGGFGNNYVDHREEKRYREYDSFPGAALNEIGGRNFVKSDARVEPAARCGSAAPARPAFTPHGCGRRCSSAASSPISTRRTGVGPRRNVGAQIDVRFSVLSALDMTVSAGAAVAFRDHADPNREAMVSVKILR